MRLIKMLGLAAIAALAAMAFAGASSTLADTFCEESGHHTNECPMGKRYAGNLLGLTTSTEAALLLQNGKIEMECHGQFLALGSTIANEGAHAGVKILIDTGAINLTLCNGICIKMDTINPAVLLGEALTLDVWFGGDPNKEEARLYNCLFEIECYYRFANAQQLASVSGDTLRLKGIALERVPPSSALCPNNNMSLDTTWLVTKDETNGAPIYLAALP